MKGIFRIPSQLYFDLWTKGNEIPSLTGDKLIAVYSILKFYRDNGIKYYAYKSKNNKNISGYALLRAKTNISLHTIEKYVPVLIEMGLCFIDNNGDFVLLGNQKTKDLYSSYKLVPIVIGKNVIETALNVMSVILFSAQKEQKNQYKKKLTRSEQLKQGADPKNSKQYKKYKAILKQFGEVTNLNEKTVLSNEGFSVIKHGKENNIKNLKSNGCYWKRRFKSVGLVKTKRVFEKIQAMTRLQYLELKKLGLLERKFTYVDGFLVEEKVSSFSAIDLTKLETVLEVTVIKEISEPITNYKKKNYLQVDMIDFWINGARGK